MPDQRDFLFTEELTLAGCGGEEVFARHLPTIALALSEQDAGERVADKPIVFNLKVTIKNRGGEGLVFISEGKLTTPGYEGSGRLGHMTRDGILKVLVERAKQQPLFDHVPAAPPAASAPTEEVHP